MTPAHLRFARNLTASLFAAAMVALFLLGVDGLVGAMQKLTRVFATVPPAPPPAAAPATPGVVPAFVVPAGEAGDGTTATRGSTVPAASTAEEPAPR